MPPAEATKLLAGHQSRELAIEGLEAAVAHLWCKPSEARVGLDGQAKCSDLAIATALTLRVILRPALHQTEGLIGCNLQLRDFDLAVPDHSTPSRRAETLEMLWPKVGSEPAHLQVVDGDTVVMSSTTKVRLTGFDTPKIRGKCPWERELARQATAPLRHLAGSGLKLERHGTDPYSRTLAMATAPAGGMWRPR
jgi:endonuclease YncB( thermonuclease family)